jgi:hypothetical protein
VLSMVLSVFGVFISAINDLDDFSISGIILFWLIGTGFFTIFILAVFFAPRIYKDLSSRFHWFANGNKKRNSL